MAEPNFPNRALYHGDNLGFLRGMNSGTVQLVATDPPFNKNRDFHATPDSLAAGARFEDRWRWDRDVHPEWLDQIQDDWPAVWSVITSARVSAGDDMAAFLVWLGVRLMECHRVLRDDGSLYLHCDHTASHYLRALLDAIFGRKNFRNEIIWCYKGPSNTRRWFPRKHDTILFYVKSDRAPFHRDAVRVPYKDLHYQHPEGGKTSGIGGKLTPENLAEFTRRGKVVEDWWPEFAAGGQMSRHERTGFPTQKPIELYKRIIQASSDEGEFVLDPFCGCATTPVAAEKLNRQWVGMDIWDGAHDQVIQRLVKKGMLKLNGDDNGQLLSFGEVYLTSTPPVRTDDRGEATPPPKRLMRVPEPPGPRQSRAEIFDLLIRQNGIACEGCDREFDDPLYLELDHKTPRSDGGVNHISNRALLCGPCNRIKSNQLTLSGLRRENERRRRMVWQT